MIKVELLAKLNGDESYSVSYSSGDLIRDAMVDFYNERTGKGYQRGETTRAKRGRDIEVYLRRCVSDGMPPQLFEMTANARIGPRWGGEGDWKYDALDTDGKLGILTIEIDDDHKLSMIDGGTRLLGIENALVHDVISESTTFDVRIFMGLSIAEEIARFLLINENQKKVRTDLSLRVVQRLVDEVELTDGETKLLSAVVGDTDNWRYTASRIAAKMNTDDDSPWRDRIQMPGDLKRPLTLQAFFSSLKAILDDPDITTQLEQMHNSGDLMVEDSEVAPAEFLTRVLKNFWNAVASVDPDGHAEPDTTVLWGAIGASSCHIALSAILKTILGSSDRTLTEDRFKKMLRDSEVASYDYWFTKKGSKRDDEHYPSIKGLGTTMTGAANYSRLAKTLEKEWRSNLHADASKATAVA